MPSPVPCQVVTTVALVGTYADVLEMFSTLGVSYDYLLTGEVDHPLEENHIYRYVGHHCGTVSVDSYDHLIEVSPVHSVTLR